MRVFYLLLFSQAVSAQLQCDKTIIRDTIGRTLNLACTFSANRYRFSRKYWCAGESRSTCEILMDTDGFTKAQLRGRARIAETGLRNFHIQITGLQLSDTGIYWVGIEKDYADIMVKIQLEVTDEAVSRPGVRPVGSPLLTCEGRSLTLRCRSERGSNVQYSWYRNSNPESVLLQSSSDLLLHCASITQDHLFICSAQNTVSRENSTAVFIQLLQPGHEEHCIYSVTSEGIEVYNCLTTTLPPTTTLAPITTAQTTLELLSSPLASFHSEWQNQSVPANQTWIERFFLSSWSGVPLWYDVIRWVLFLTLAATVGLVQLRTCCTRNSRNKVPQHSKNTSDSTRVYCSTRKCYI